MSTSRWSVTTATLSSQSNTGVKTVWSDRLTIVGSRVSGTAKRTPGPHTKGAGHAERYHLRGSGRAQGGDQRGDARAGRDASGAVADGQRPGRGSPPGAQAPALGGRGPAAVLR